MADAHHVYMGGAAGPFRCDHCEYYGPAQRCNEEHIIALARKGQFGLTLAGEQARVDAAGCSDYFEPSQDFSGDHDAGSE